MHAVQIGLVLVDHGLHGADILVGGLHGRLRWRWNRLRRSQRRFLRLTSASGCTFSIRASSWPLRTRSPSLTRSSRDAAPGVRADVDVILGLNFAGRSDEAGQVLAHDLAGLHGDHAPLAVDGAGIDADSQQSATTDTPIRIFHLRLHDKNLPFYLSPVLDANMSREFRQHFTPLSLVGSLVSEDLDDTLVTRRDNATRREISGPCDISTAR